MSITNNFVLPTELGRIILDFFGDPDMLGYLSVVAKSWFLQPTEANYEQICRHIYLTQATKKLLNMLKWGSWMEMLRDRPRLRTNGFYCLLTVFSKQPSNDRFWEEKVKEFPNVAFYRYLRFYHDGRVLYSIATSTQHDILPLLAAGNEVPKRIYLGHYTLQRNEVTIQFSTHYSAIQFKLLIGNSAIGHHNRLTLVEHNTAAIGDDGFEHRTSLRVPEFNEFEYYREWKWHG